MCRLRRLPPVDGNRRIFRAITPELPEALAHAGLAAAVHAEAHGGREPFGFHHQGRQGCCELLGFALERGRHARDQRRLWQSRSTTLVTVAPSARAEKLSAMR